MTATKRAPKPVTVVAEEEATSIEEVISTPPEDIAEAAEVDETPTEGGVEEAKPKRQNFSHTNCDHEATKAARAKCRKGRGTDQPRLRALMPRNPSQCSRSITHRP